MKKVFLSAIMLIAFSTVSFANGIADEEVVIADLKEAVVTPSKGDNLKYEFCVVSTADVLEMVSDAIEMTDVEAYYWWQAAMDYCMTH